MDTREQTIDTPDGGSMGAYLALPDSGSGPGVLVLMEIYGVGSYIRRAAQIECPAIFHFGAEDQYIPLQAAEKVCAAAAERPDWECHIQPDGGHAFDNHEAPMFSRPEAAARAWELTRSFLAANLR